MTLTKLPQTWSTPIHQIHLTNDIYITAGATNIPPTSPQHRWCRTWLHDPTTTNLYKPTPSSRSSRPSLLGRIIRF